VLFLHTLYYMTSVYIRLWDDRWDSAPSSRNFLVWLLPATSKH